MNSNNLNISVPSPCSENWNNMTPSEKGRHCKSCNHEVVDFTGFTPSQLHQYFIEDKNFTCGIFRNDQLSTFQNQALGHLRNQSLVKTVMMAASLTVIGANAMAQSETPVDIDPNQYKIGEVVLAQDTVLIQGQVVQDGKPISGLSVRVESHSSVVAKTDSLGYFTLHFFKEEFENEMVIQVIDSKTNTYIKKVIIVAPFDFVTIELPVMCVKEIETYEVTDDRLQIIENVQHTAGVPINIEIITIPEPSFNFELPESANPPKKKGK